jgi:pteridine reductase
MHVAEFTLEFHTDMDESLQGKVVLVTGAARRIGAAIARRLHASGADVLLHYRGAEAEAASLEAELNAARAKSASKIKADLLAPVAPRMLVRAAIERFGRLDVLVNNASTFYPTAVGSIEAGHWEELMGSNLRAPLFLAQEAAPQLKKGGGAIVNLSDIHANRPLKGYLVYSIAKAGLVALTRSLALELAPEIRVNAVAPGAVAWPEDGQFEPAERERIVATTPLARLGSPEEIARAVHFLATAPFVTGQILSVDGGRSIFL